MTILKIFMYLFKRETVSTCSQVQGGEEEEEEGERES